MERDPWWTFDEAAEPLEPEPPFDDFDLDDVELLATGDVWPAELEEPPLEELIDPPWPEDDSGLWV